MKQAEDYSESEDWLKPLSNRDRDFFLDLLENPPPPSERLIRAMREHREREARCKRSMETEPLLPLLSEAVSDDECSPLFVCGNKTDSVES